MNFGPAKQFLKAAFSDNGTPSSSRLLTVPHSIAAIFVLVYLTIHTGHYPGMDEATGLGAFATAHYAINRVSNMFGGQKNAAPPPVPPVPPQI
jgi:hypothetical protein